MPFLEEALTLPWNTIGRAIDPTLLVGPDGKLHCFFVGSQWVAGAGGKKKVKANLLGHAVTDDAELVQWTVLTKDAPLLGASERAKDGVENVAVFRRRDGRFQARLLAEAHASRGWLLPIAARPHARAHAARVHAPPPPLDAPLRAARADDLLGEPEQPAPRVRRLGRPLHLEGPGAAAACRLPSGAPVARRQVRRAVRVARAVGLLPDGAHGRVQHEQDRLPPVGHRAPRLGRRRGVGPRGREAAIEGASWAVCRVQSVKSLGRKVPKEQRLT